MQAPQLHSWKFLTGLSRKRLDEKFIRDYNKSKRCLASYLLTNHKIIMTQNYDDVFNQPEEKVEWVSFKAVGDKISGTYVDLNEDVDGFGNAQLVVSLLRDGVKYKYGVRHTHTWLTDQVKRLRLGQIIGFIFSEEKPSGKGQPTKIIQLKQNPAFIDEAWTKNWVESQARMGIPADVALRPAILTGVTAAPVTPVPTAAPAPATATPVAAAAPEVAQVNPAPVVNPMFDTIRNLAVSKGIIAGTASPAEIDAKIKEVTGLDVTEVNATQIIVNLSTIAVG